jgi:hypothetical protein
MSAEDPPQVENLAADEAHDNEDGKPTDNEENSDAEIEVPDCHLVHDDYHSNPNTDKGVVIDKEMFKSLVSGGSIGPVIEHPEHLYEVFDQMMKIGKTLENTNEITNEFAKFVHVERVVGTKRDARALETYKEEPSPHNINKKLFTIAEELSFQVISQSKTLSKVKSCFEWNSHIEELTELESKVATLQDQNDKMSHTIDVARKLRGDGSAKDNKNVAKEVYQLFSNITDKMVENNEKMKRELEEELTSQKNPKKKNLSKVKSPKKAKKTKKGKKKSPKSKKKKGK